MTGAHVFVLEDDSELRELLVRGLREEGFRTSSAASGGELMLRAAEDGPDAFVVDVGLPDADGRDVVQALRTRGVAAPVIFLTAHDTLPDRLSGFAAGGDDYLAKPFAFAELVARIRALLKRSAWTPEVETSGLTLDPSGHTLSIGGQTIELTPTEFRLLARLGRDPGEAVTRRALVEAAWPHGAIVHDNTLDVYVGRLRRKLGSLPSAPRIVTVRGLGYSLR